MGTTHQAAPFDRYEGIGHGVATFQELDAGYAMKLPALFHPCLASLTEILAERFDLFGMGGRGIAPITYYLEISGTPEPLALGRPLENRYRIELFRAKKPAAGGAGARSRERLLLDQHVEVRGFRRSGSAHDLGFDDGTGPAVPAGAFRLIQIITRPLAPPAERVVADVPYEFADLRERPFPEPYPTPELLWEVPAGFEPVATGGASDPFRVWGQGNTDINHHVTVTDYLRAFESQLVQWLDLAGLPVRAHRLGRLRCIFRRPAFAGEAYRLQGDVLRHGADTRLHAGIYRRLENGEAAPDPSVAACLEGGFESVMPEPS